MTPEIQAIHAQDIATMIYILKVIGMWIGLALVIHFISVRLYKLAWLASGHQTSFRVNYSSFIVEIVLIITTLVLWLDHYGKL